MPKYMVQGSLSASGMAGVVEEGGSRRHLAVKKAVESMGGKLEGYYFSFGHSDVVGILEMPSNVAMAGLAAAFASGGAVSSLVTTALLTPEEVDEAVKLHPDYTPPTDSRSSGR
ncbi:MAG: GYD domain-containing protein [Acidimicrobiia bacterium]|nr:GYD domain-containing protein [Acidimicrobiia bacterium]